MAEENHVKHQFCSTTKLCGNYSGFDITRRPFNGMYLWNGWYLLSKLIEIVDNRDLSFILWRWLSRVAMAVVRINSIKTLKLRIIWRGFLFGFHKGVHCLYRKNIILVYIIWSNHPLATFKQLTKSVQNRLYKFYQ